MRRERLASRFLEFLPEIVAADSVVDDVPGEDFVLRFLAVDVERGIEAECLRGPLQVAVVEHRIFESVRDTPVAQGKDRLMEARPRALADRLDVRDLRERLAQVLEFLVRLFDVLHLQPLERRPRLGHEGIHRRMNAADASARLAHLEHDLPDLLGQSHDRLHVGMGLERKTDHEVELEILDAVFEDPARPGQDVFVRELLVQDLPHPVRTAFGGQGQPLDAGVDQLEDELRREVIETQ